MNAHQYADREIDELEKRLSKVYDRAAKDIDRKTKEYFKTFKAEDAKKSKLVLEGKISKKEYEKWRIEQMMTGKNWKEFNYQIATSLKNANADAVAITNGALPKVYSFTYNEVGVAGEQAVRGYSFNLVNRDAVANLAKSDKTLLPYKKLDGRKDVRWNTRKINSEVMQGILQGESIDKIADRFQNIVGMNRESAIRNARTSVTSAENKGNFDGMHRLQDDGLMVMKEWLATHDGRTRQSHLDFEAIGPIDVDEEFDVGLMYPGDPDGEPEEVYNCRCTMKTKIIGYNGHLFP